MGDSIAAILVGKSKPRSATRSHDVDTGMVSAAERFVRATERHQDGGPRAVDAARALRDFVRMVLEQEKRSKHDDDEDEEDD